MANRRKTIRVPTSYIEIMDRLIEQKIIPCYAEAVRNALDRSILRDLKIYNEYQRKIMENEGENLNIIEPKQKKMDDFF
ncbi:MAG: hypothetical protein EU549_00340 [Promethearchaeota archaeon]|nr:MAG: hypothetical protein EU549_00340 [Candidatus Lokiarchaeota archaeon]